MPNDGKIIVSGTSITYAGDDLNNKGFFATANGTGTPDDDLLLAHPAGVAGWYAVVGSTDTIWIWDDDDTQWEDSGTAFVAGGMLVSVYDPGSVADDCFDMDNMVEGSTNKILTQAERDKLNGIDAGAEENVNADWNSSSGDSEILNKPTIPTTTADLPDSLNKRYVTDAQLSILASSTASFTTADETTIDNLETTYEPITQRPATQPVISSGTPNTLTLNCNSKKAARFEPRLSSGTRSINVDFDLILSNVTNLEDCHIILSLTGNVNITFDSSTISNDEVLGSEFSWDDSTDILTVTADTDDIYELILYKDQTSGVYILKAAGAYV